MTPERKAYLDRCSKWELKLRGWIDAEKEIIKEFKERIGESYDLWTRETLRVHKRYLQMYRHELAIHKSMDRATSIYRTYDKETGLTS